MLTTFVYFVKSECFNDDTFKLVISNCTPEDVITAHRDVYCSKDEGREPFFHVPESILVHDKNLFNDYRSKLSNKSSPRKDFYPETHRVKIKQLIESVNSLVHLIEKSPSATDYVYEDLIVTEEVANFEPCDISGIDESNNELNDPASINSNNLIDSSSFILMTKLLHIQESEGSVSSLAEPIAEQDSWSPMYNPFIIFNKGYGYLLKPFREIFPEFTIDVHNRFPKISLAEDMLWYQLNELYPEDDDSKFNTNNVKAMIEKIRVFFDCSSTKKLSQDSFEFLSFQNIPVQPPPPSIHSIPPPTTQDSLPFSGSTPLPFQPIDEISNNFPWYDCNPAENNKNQQPSHGPEFLNVPLSTRFPSNNDLRGVYKTLMSEQGSRSSPPQSGQSPGSQGISQGISQPLPMIPGVQHSSYYDKTSYSASINPAIRKQLGAHSEFAEAFPMIPNQKHKNTFGTTENIWNNETKKEISDVTVHAEKRILLREFVDDMCHQFHGSKVKSSKLFEIFKDFYNTKHLNLPFDKAFNQTSFTCIMKEVSTFHTKREKDGMYWVDLHVGQKPNYTVDRIMKPKETKIKSQPKTTKVDFSSGDDVIESKDSITLAEILRSE